MLPRPFWLCGLAASFALLPTLASSQGFDAGLLRAQQQLRQNAVQAALAARGVNPATAAAAAQLSTGRYSSLRPRLGGTGQGVGFATAPYGYPGYGYSGYGYSGYGYRYSGYNPTGFGYGAPGFGVNYAVPGVYNRGFGLNPGLGYGYGYGPLNYTIFGSQSRRTSRRLATPGSHYFGNPHASQYFPPTP